MYLRRLRISLLVRLICWTKILAAVTGQNEKAPDTALQIEPLQKQRESDPMARMWKKQGDNNREWSAWEYYSGDGPTDNWDSKQRSQKIKNDEETTIDANPTSKLFTPRAEDVYSSVVLPEPSSNVAMVPPLQSSFIEDWSSTTSEYEEDLTRTSLPYEGPSSLLPSIEVTALMSSVVPTRPTADYLEVPSPSPTIIDQNEPSSTIASSPSSDLQSSILYSSSSTNQSDFNITNFNDNVEAASALHGSFGVPAESVTIVNFVTTTGMSYSEVSASDVESSFSSPIDAMASINVAISASMSLSDEYQVSSTFAFASASAPTDSITIVNFVTSSDSSESVHSVESPISPSFETDDMTLSSTMEILPYSNQAEVEESVVVGNSTMSLFSIALTSDSLETSMTLPESYLTSTFIPLQSSVSPSESEILLESATFESSEFVPESSTDLAFPDIPVQSVEKTKSGGSLQIEIDHTPVTKILFSSDYASPSVVIILVPSVHIVESWDSDKASEYMETVDAFEPSSSSRDFSTATWFGVSASTRLMVRSSDIDTPIFSDNDYVAPKESREPTVEPDISSLQLPKDTVSSSSSIRVPRSLNPNEGSDFSRWNLKTTSEYITPSPTSKVVIVVPDVSESDDGVKSEEVISPVKSKPVTEIGVSSVEPTSAEIVMSTPEIQSILISTVLSDTSVFESIDITPTASEFQIIKITTIDPSPMESSVILASAQISTKRQSVEEETAVVDDGDVQTKYTSPLESVSVVIDNSETVLVSTDMPVSPSETEVAAFPVTSTTIPTPDSIPDPTTTQETKDVNNSQNPSDESSNQSVETSMTSLNWETSTTGSSKMELPYMLDKAYWLRTIIKAESQQWKPYTWEDLPRRLVRAYELGQRRIRTRNSRAKRNVNEDGKVTIRLVGWAVDAIHNRTELWYTVALNEVPVRATPASNVINKLSKDEIEKELGFEVIVPAEPFVKETSLSTMSQGRQWVILVAIAVTGLSVALLVCGALAYYRCCKKTPKIVEVDAESEQGSTSYGFRNVEQALQEGTVSLSVVRQAEDNGVKSKKSSVDDAKRPLPTVPGTSTSSGSESERSVIKAKSKRFRTLLESEATQTQSAGIVNPAFEDSSPDGMATSRRKMARKPIKANGNASSPTGSEYFDHVSVPSPKSPHETDTLPSQAQLPQQVVKEGRRRHSNKVSASPPDVLPTEIKVQEKIDELLDDTIAKTAGRRLYSSARSKRVQPERGDTSQSPGFQSFRSPKHKKSTTFGDRHNSVCETLAENELSGKEDASAPKVVWSTFKGGSPNVTDTRSLTASDTLRGSRDQLTACDDQTEPLFQHSDKHPARKGQGKSSCSTPESPMELGRDADSQQHPSARGRMVASAPVLVDVHEKEGQNPEDYIGAVKVTEPAQSVIKAIRDELKKFNSSLPGTSTESNA